ncbi:Anaerobic sulfite reductase subunit A [Pseudovibrio axinellae]|uniref:Anaerobic sulfite reductase subunit A n=1 Tax=Pseudovibrio axinellae TaxID=989403 RepID=A0A165WA80_9HYPH|nr:4Fe-4S dicluster domain-containing protein [Pseudovibrio axinellae]KZL16275.1 Anaerobic sulfite reductase subunit A [Pseudovibrio axinellae]SER78683.1 4Fe-4S dicluster containing protein [Pseudovibrio axinellae]
MTKPNNAFVIQREDLHILFDVLIERGYTPVGPTVREAVIVYDELSGLEDLPEGWAEEQDAGTYSLKRRGDNALFGFNNGPHSWKNYLFPSRVKLWEGDKTEDGGFTVKSAVDTQKKFAFIGVRACDLHAIQVQDKVFLDGEYRDPIYSKRREEALVIAVNCGQAAKTCFCTSMNTGPRVSDGYDLALTEILDNDQHYFLAEPGSTSGFSLLAEIPHSEASQEAIAAARGCTKQAQEQMGRKIDISDVKEMLYRNYDNDRWDELEKRCLSCGNCTMACPTCFCSKVEDVTDLTGNHAERWREWESCFTMDFSYIHGGSVRPTTRSRYRQWLVHKLAAWLDQFGTSGCVGCGRCITWCPVGIDLTEEVRLLRNSEN